MILIMFNSNFTLFCSLFYKLVKTYKILNINALHTEDTGFIDYNLIL